MFFAGRVGLTFTTFTSLRRPTRLFARAYHGHFSTTDGKIWKRKLEGLEDLSAAIANASSGFGQGIIAFELKPTKEPISLLEAVRKAWIRTRFLAPLIALRTDNEPGSQGGSFFFSYESPKANLDIISKWANETVVWHPEDKTLSERDLDLADHWWNTEDHWNMEMHVGRHGDNIQLALSVTHWTIDVGLVFPLMDKFFEYLVAELEERPGDIKELPWGDEIPQLPPSISAVIAPPYRGEVIPPMPTDNMPSLFCRPAYPAHLPASTSHSTVNHSITLSAAQTQAFRANCKAQGYLVTPVVNAILVLADVETALRVGTRKGAEAFKEVYQSFQQSQGFSIPANGANRRGAFVPEHRDLFSPLGAPGIAAEAFPTVHDMNPIRKCIHVNDDGHIERTMSQDAFWDSAVANAEQILGPGRAIPPHFLANQRALNAGLASFVMGVIQSGILSSSVGDMARAGFLERWQPSKREGISDAIPALTIEEIILSPRMTAPTISSTVWQYDGKFRMQLRGARQFHDDDAWRDFTTAVESRLMHVVEGRL
ncbi:hypothetical protein HWV62_31760 [Athelia sp. TMB]|nr:hypothetical protein HWV62_31760 [Athelia sp. TMB]